MPPIAIEGGTLRPHAITSDGKRLAGLALSPEAVRLGVGWHDLATGETWVSRDGPTVSVPTWLDDQHLVFAVNRRYLAVVDTSKKRRIIGGPFSFSPTTNLMPAVSPDHRTIFVGAETTEADVWMVERGKGN